MPRDTAANMAFDRRKASIRSMTGEGSTDDESIREEFGAGDDLEESVIVDAKDQVADFDATTEFQTIFLSALIPRLNAAPPTQSTAHTRNGVFQPYMPTR